MPRLESHSHGDFNWFDLNSKDLTKSKVFYGTLFGWKATDQPMTDESHGAYVMFDVERDPVAGAGQMSTQMIEQGVPSSWNVYVAVDALEPVLERVQSGGGRVLFEPFDVFDHGRLAFFADPEGAVLALWQPKQHDGTGRRGEHGTVCWTELATRDIAAARDFYRSVFGWEDVDHPQGMPGYRVLRNQGRDIGGMIGMTDEWGDMPAHWSVYFEVDDIDAAAGQVTGLGGAVHHGPFDAPGVGRIAVCADDVGAHFYLMQLDPSMKA